jgi:hypothetical protein
MTCYPAQDWFIQSGTYCRLSVQSADSRMEKIHRNLPARGRLGSCWGKGGVSHHTSRSSRGDLESHHASGVANSKYRANALASCICLGVRHCTSNTEGEATRTQTHFAREVATLSRFRL